MTDINESNSSEVQLLTPLRSPRNVLMKLATVPLRQLTLWLVLLRFLKMGTIRFLSAAQRNISNFNDLGCL